MYCKFSPGLACIQRLDSRRAISITSITVNISTIRLSIKMSFSFNSIITVTSIIIVISTVLSGCMESFVHTRFNVSPSLFLTVPCDSTLSCVRRQNTSM